LWRKAIGTMQKFMINNERNNSKVAHLPCDIVVFAPDQNGQRTEIEGLEAK
jgi:hypothetical protein